MKFTSTQASFKSGRLSPKLTNRVDTKQYGDGASVLKGYKVIPEGGVERVKGTQWLNINQDLAGIATSRGDSALPIDSRVISFNYNGKPLLARLLLYEDNEVYLLMYEYPFAYKDDVDFKTRIVSSGDFTYALNQFDWTVVDDWFVITHFSGTFIPLYFKLNSVLADVELYPMANTLFGSFAYGPTTIGYNEVNQDLTYVTQLMPLRHLQFPMTDLGKNSTPLTITGWDATAKTFELTPTTGNPEATAILQAAPVIYLEAIGSKNYGDGVVRSIVASGYYIVIGQDSLNLGVVVSPVELLDDIDIFEILDINDVNLWSVSIFHKRNWPKTVTTNEGRLVFGGTPETPLTFFGSKVGNPFYFSQQKKVDPGSEFFGVGFPAGETLATDPYVFTVASKGDGEILFTQSAQTLVIGTDQKEYIGSGGDTILSPLSVSLNSVSSAGSIPVTTSNNGDSVFFVGNGGRSLNRLKYSRQNGSHVSQDMGVLFSDLLEDDTIKQIMWCANLQAFLIVMDSGKLYGIVDNQSSEMTAFFDTGITDVRSIAYVPYTRPVPLPAFMTSYGYDRGAHIVLDCLTAIYAFEQTVMPTYDVVDGNHTASLMHKYMNGTSYFTTGGMTGIWKCNEQNIDLEDVAESLIPVPLHVRDAMVAGKTIYILDTDTGELVTDPVLTALDTADDALDAQYYTAPTTGFTEPPTNVAVGILPEACQVATMPVEAGQQWGSAQMGIKNIDTLGIRHYKTFSYEVSSNGTDWEEVVVADTEGQPTTGRKEKKFTSSPAYDQIVYIRNTKAEPCTIIGINMRGVSNDG